MKKYERKTTLYEYCVAENKQWILQQFDYGKNFPDTPCDLMKSSNKKVWFTFGCGHSCQQRIADKTGKDSMQCPTCLNRGKIGKSLLLEYPYYASMFMEDKNKVRADEVSYRNGKAYWWKCKRCGNEFQGRVTDVVRGKRVCNECTNRKRSFPEYCLGFYFLEMDEGREINKVLEGYKFDFFLPKYNLIVEYDGYPWHDSDRARENDVRKDRICRDRKLFILRIRDSRLKVNEDLTADIWRIKYDEQLLFLGGLPDVLSKYTGDKMKLPDINIKRDFAGIKLFQEETEKRESLLEHMPQLKEFLDSDQRNGDPEYVSNASHEIRFWLRHPQYTDLKWSMTAHDLFRKQEPYTQWIKMCIKLMNRYPELEKQVSEAGNNIREGTKFELTCFCGRKFERCYAALMGKNKVKMCSECRNACRIQNFKAAGRKGDI